MNRRLFSLFLSFIPLVFVLMLAANVSARTESAIPDTSRQSDSVVSASPLDVVVSEVAWMGGTAGTSDEWLELHNNTSGDIDLNGWRLLAADGTPDIALSGVIPGNGAFMLERTDDDTAPVLADLIYAGGLENGGEVITLTDAMSNVIDVIGTVAGWPAGDNSTKATMERIDLTASGTDVANWQDGVVEGSPTNSILDNDADTFGYSPNVDWSAGTGTGFEAFGEDCDDARDDTYPGAPEVLDVYDNDCDVEMDEDFVLGEFDYEVIFNSENLFAFDTTTATTAIENAALDLINGAQYSIDLAIYGFSRTSLRDALIAAHNRGVTVRVAADYGEYHNTERGSPHAGSDNVWWGGAAVLEAATIDQPNSRNDVLSDLETAGIAVYPSNYVSYLQHNKFMVIDDEMVFTGSTNWTDTGMTVNMNNALVITSSHIAAAYGIEFAEMVELGRFATAKLDNTPHVFTFTNATVEVYFSPSDMVEERLVEVFQSAEESLDFSMFFWTSDVLGDLAVSRFLTDDLEIQGVWDAVGARNAFSEDNKMCDAGIPLKIELAGGKAHNKYGVFDANGVNPVVVTGSYNWTAAGTESNDENTLIIRGNSDLAQAYKADMLSVYNALPAETICANISPESGLAACSNGRDDDFDGYIDGDDFNCQESTVMACTDGEDNDGDGDIDMDDLDCFLLPSVPTAVEVSVLALSGYRYTGVTVTFLLLLFLSITAGARWTTKFAG